MNYQGVNIPKGYTEDGTINKNDGYQPMYQGAMCTMCQQPYQNYNQVVNKCFVQDVPHYVNYNTHVVNNCIKRHYMVPTYTQTQETVFYDEYQNQCGQQMCNIGCQTGLGTPIKF